MHSICSVGENLYYSWGMDVSEVPAVAVKKWYDEIVDHDYNNPRFDFKTGHFTQVTFFEFTFAFAWNIVGTKLSELLEP